MQIDSAIIIKYKWNGIIIKMEVNMYTLHWSKSAENCYDTYTHTLVLRKKKVLHDLLVALKSYDLYAHQPTSYTNLA